MSKQLTKDLTPWQSFFDKEYLGSHNFDDGEEKAVTVKSASKRKVTKPGGKSDECLVIEFNEKDVKPMVINVTNAKAIQKTNGSRHIENWPGTKLVLYVDHAVKFAGKMVDGIRVKQPTSPEPQKDQLHNKHPKWNDCVAAMIGGYKIENIRSKYNVSANVAQELQDAVDNADQKQ